MGWELDLGKGRSRSAAQARVWSRIASIALLIGAVITLYLVYRALTAV